MRYAESMSFESTKTKMEKVERTPSKMKGEDKPKEERKLAGSKDYDYANLKKTKKVLTNNGRF